VVLAILLYLNAVSTFPLGSREEGSMREDTERLGKKRVE
jgi:hypothetical protein